MNIWVHSKEELFIIRDKGNFVETTELFSKMSGSAESFFVVIVVFLWFIITYYFLESEVASFPLSNIKLRKTLLKLPTAS